MKFLAIGTHGHVDPEEGRRVAPDALAWLRAKLADGTLDCAYSLEGGGRMLVVNAESREALDELLAAAPDVPRQWDIRTLADAAETIEKYLASLQ